MMRETLSHSSTAMTGRDVCWRSEKIASLALQPEVMADVVASVGASALVAALVAEVGLAAAAEGSEEEEEDMAVEATVEEATVGLLLLLPVLVATTLVLPRLHPIHSLTMLLPAASVAR